MTYRVGFFGTPVFARTILEALLATSGISVSFVVTQPDKPAGRGKQLQQSPVKQLALANALPVLQPTSLKKETADFVSQMEKFGPIDGVIVAAYGKIIPASLLELFRGNWVNVHASLLPRWRGAAPIHRAIMAGDHATGICLMKMEEGLDTGDVFAAASEPILSSDCTGTLHDRLAALGGKLCSEHMANILSGRTTPTAQAAMGGEVCYADKIQPSECLIDWDRPAAAVCCQVRGLWPWPGAFSFLGERRIKIADAVVLPTEIDPSKSRHKPGEVLRGPDGELHVQAGDGIVGLRLVQLEGKRALPVDEFLKGNPIPAGVMFGTAAPAPVTASSSKEL